MPRGGRPDEAVADIASRTDALRQAAVMPGADLRTLMDAALTELDAAIEAIGAAAGAAGSADPETQPESVRAERRLLHGVFQQAPVPLFLLEQDGTIRRANNRAAALLGSPPGYATGKSLTAFIDLPFRAAIQTQLAAAMRTGKPRTANCRHADRGRADRHRPQRGRRRPAWRPARAHRDRAGGTRAGWRRRRAR